MYRAPSRAASPFAPENLYHPQQQPHQHHPQQPYSPSAGSGGQIAPGSVTYTTSSGPDGRVVYHPFKAVAASYQTPNGIVSGIQWVPAEATQILPAGAQPANSEFAASWNRGYLSKDDQKALKEWQREEDRRRRKEEKESSKRLREKERMGQTRGDSEYELRMARERDAQTAVARERRKSFNAGAGGMPGSVAFPTSGSNAGYPATGGVPYSSSAHSGYNDRDRDRNAATGGGIYRSSTTTPYGRDRKYSTGDGLSDVDRQFGDLDLDRNQYGGERERKMSGIGRPRKYSTSEAGGERMRTVSGNMGDRPNAYNSSGAYAPATGPYSRPYSAASAGGNQYPTTGSQYPNTSPAMRANEGPYAPTAVTGYPGSNYSSSPARATVDPFARSTTPFGSGGGGGMPQQGQVYPRGHVMEGQTMGPRSRAPSPMPGAMGPGAPGVSFPPGPTNFPQASPRMPDAAFSGEQSQLAAPEGFSRPINAAQPYTPFETMKIQNMDDFVEHIPRMPLVLQPHDVYHEDWVRMMQDLALAWSGRLPVPELTRGGRAPRRSTLAADLIDLWNASFFLARGVEVVLYKGRERRSGNNAGVIDAHISAYDDSESPSSSSASSSEDSDLSDDDRHRPGPYGGYGRPGAGPGNMGDVSEARRRRREARAEKKRRRRERRLRRKARAKEKKYALYLTCVPQGHGGPGGMSGGMNSGMSGGYPGMPGSYGGGMATAGSHGHGGGY